MLATLKANAGFPPTTLGGQQSASKPTTFNFKAPNYTATQTNGTESLIETGNKNILTNPSFEHSTFSTGWTLSASSTTDSTTAIDGSSSALLVSSAASISAYQDSTLYNTELDDGVQCLAQVRIKSDVALQVCARVGGTTSTTDCVTTNTDSKWALYKVPFICGATSNGISIASSGSVTGGAYIDDAFVGAVDVKQDMTSSRIAGEAYIVAASCEWTRASTTLGAFATTAACPGPTVTYSSMGSWQTTDSDLPRFTVNSLPPGVYKATFYVYSDQSGSGQGPTFSINDGTTSCQAVGGTDGTEKGSTTVSCIFNYTSIGNRVFELYGSSATGTITVSAFSGTGFSNPIKFQLEYFGNNQIYSASCGANCVDTFSAKVSASNVISDENVDWVTTSSGTLTKTLNFKSGIFTVTPNCVTTVGDATGPAISAAIGATSTSSIVVSFLDYNGNGQNDEFTIVCQKQGADFVATRTIVGSFNEVVTAPGITKPKTCYYAFGGASATLASPTECTTGTCVEVYDSCGAITPPAYSATANYTAATIANGTFANSSFIQCSCEAYDTTTSTPKKCSPYFTTGNIQWTTNSSGGAVLNFRTDVIGGGANDSYVSFKCEGAAP